MNCVMCQRTMIRPFSRETTPQLCVCEMEHYQCLECDEHMARHCGFCGEITHLLSVTLRLELELDVGVATTKAHRSAKPGNDGKMITLWQNDNLSDFTRYCSRTNLLEKKRSRSEVSARKSSPVKPRRRSNSLDGDRPPFPESPLWENASSQDSEENAEVELEEQQSSEGTLKAEQPVEESTSEISKLEISEMSGKSEKSGRSQRSEKSKKSKRSRKSKKSDKSEMSQKQEYQEALENLEKLKTKKSESQEKPKTPELEEKPENPVASTQAKQENKPVPVERNVLGPRNNYSLSLLASDPPNTDQNALCNLISMVRRVIYTGRKWKDWHSSSVGCPSVFFDELMKIRMSVVAVDLPIAMENITRTIRLAKCPEFNCPTYLCAEGLNDHLVGCHRFWTIDRIRLGEPKSFCMDLRLTLRNVPKCHAVMQVENVVTGFGFGEQKNLLPIMVMSMHIKLGDITANSNSQEQLTAIWATTVVTDLLPLRITLSMWSLEGDRPECIISYTGQGYDLRNTRRPLKLLRSGRAIILTADQVEGLTQNGMEMVGIQISVKMDVSVMVTEGGTPLDTDTQDGSEDESEVAGSTVSERTLAESIQ
ncbi:uncharacterized protein Dana_GF19506 [Drosophila ananassae]|uniref:DUF4729 domain-containing protein n=1 Tax=Drosophila ananassae TaxID=7217 RepID=B3MXR0_DROAN|nr:uncharacterized protein LOC6502263 [Drosophila ananassae]EDV38525.1 uncharacterized protein Dana_GF19506 [Drosophila ananassae]